MAKTKTSSAPFPTPAGGPEAIRHTGATRPYTPTTEEAGYEQDNPRVLGQPTRADYPKNPVVERGKDPELFWLDKYGPDDRADRLQPDIRSLYRHEHVSPELLLARLRRPATVADAGSKGLQTNLLQDLFGPTFTTHDEADKPLDYYQHPERWSNRLIQGDSLLVMTSLLEREGLEGSVQCLYFDPPYGIKYNSNWQMKLNSRDVTDGKDEFLTPEPEQIKAFRDTWEHGIHSYLGYLRDRLIVAQRLLTDSGSCFVQISDENVHLVRCLMDEVFGSENFVSLISYKTTSSLGGDLLSKSCDYIIWYSKDVKKVKFQPLYAARAYADDIGGRYSRVELADGTRRVMTNDEKQNPDLLPKGARIYRHDNLTSQSGGETTRFNVSFEGQNFTSGKGFWKTHNRGIDQLIAARRIAAPTANSLAYIRFFDDFPYTSFSNVWTDTQTGAFTDDKIYVVQTNLKIVQRCILMTTDPGDLVLDPTCGSGTTAYVAEQWGRRWVTIDTSRIALNLAKTRLTTAVFPWYRLYDETGHDIRHGFQYRTVPHITLKSLANDEPAPTETLYDQPLDDKTRLRVAGPFTVETLQADLVLSADDMKAADAAPADQQRFLDRVFAHLTTNGLRNGIKQEQAILSRVEALPGPWLHAAGYYPTPEGGERKVYLHVGPQFAAVSKAAYSKAIQETRARNDADWLVVLGFQFESELTGAQDKSKQYGSFRVDLARMHDDLLQDGLLKKGDKKAASFVILGEPDMDLLPAAPDPTTGAARVQLRINGLDIYDPIADQLKPRDRADIAYWSVDDDYDGSCYITRQLFFCGGEKKEFAKWERKLSDQVKLQARQQLASQLRLVLNEEAFDRLYGFESHPILATPGRRLAVRVVSQFGEESTRVLTV